MKIKSGFIIDEESPYNVAFHDVGAMFALNDKSALASFTSPVVYAPSHDISVSLLSNKQRHFSPVHLDISTVKRPWKHQARIINDMSVSNRYYLASAMRTGKSMMSLWCVDYLFKQRNLNRCLIVSPLSVIADTWVRELKSDFPHISYRVCHASTAAEKSARLVGKEQVHIVNYDMLQTYNKELLRNNYDIVILDEAKAFSNHTTHRWKAVKMLANKASVVYALSGSPAPNSVLDMYAQLKLVFGDSWSSMTKQQFIDTYRDKLHVVSNSKFGAVHAYKDKANAYEELVKTIPSYGRATLSEALPNLPDVSHVDHHVPASVCQHSTIQHIKLDARAILSDGSNVTVQSVTALRAKILVCAGGAISNDKQIMHDLEPTGKLDCIDSILEQNRLDAMDSFSPGAVILCAFRSSVEIVSKHLKSKGFNYGVITGSTSADDRAKIFDGVRNGSIDGVVATAASIMTGVNLSSLNTIIWYNPPASTEIYEQSNERIKSATQTRKMIIHHITCCIEEELATKAIKTKSSLHQIFLEHLRK